MKHGIKFNEKTQKWKYKEIAYKYQSPVEIIQQEIRSRLATARLLLTGVKREKKPRDYDYLNEKKKITRLNDVKKILREVEELKKVIEVIQK